MGLRIKKFFLVTLVVVYVSNAGLIIASPVAVRGAFDTSPSGLNHVVPNGIVEVQHLQDVDATIKEVEALLKADPTLPRLTRGEILDIIDNLTKADVQTAIARDPKAIMVVLPYSADSVQNGDVQALYTKPPMTHILEDGQNDESQNIKTQVPQKKHRPTKKPYQYNYDDNSGQGMKIAKVPSTEKPDKFIDQQFQQQQYAVQDIAPQKPRSTTENPFTKIINRRRKPTKLPGNHKQEILEVSTTTTTTTTTTDAPRTTRKRKGTRRPSSTTSTTTSTTTEKSFQVVPNKGINIIDPPPFQPMFVKPATIFPTSPRTVELITSPPMMVDEVQIPEDFKDVLKSLDILIKQSPTEPPTFNDPSTPETLSEDDKLKLLFASLGMQTSTTTVSPSTTEPDVMQVANNLTPEMQDLLMTFGLIPDPNKDKTTTPKPVVFMEPSSIINPESYTNFKPLPPSSNAQANEDMEDFLAKFGLVDKNKPSGSRAQKAISMSKSQNNLTPNLDVVPDGFKDIMTDIGFPIKGESQVTITTTPKSLLQTTKKADHVFNPANSGTDYATEDEINRLNQLMSVIKEFEKLNGTANEQDLKHIDLEGLKDLVNSFNLPLDQQKGPNPLDYDVGILKNEVKRQTSTTTEKPSVEPKNPSLALLEESFGGASDSVSETVNVQPQVTEAPKKTGFYYLLDWNSFFDIDNQKGKRVNLRFQPKVGDPKRFFSVAVP